jgi:hypothetical protein
MECFVPYCNKSLRLRGSVPKTLQINSTLTQLSVHKDITVLICHKSFNNTQTHTLTKKFTFCPPATKLLFFRRNNNPGGNTCKKNLLLRINREVQYCSFKPLTLKLCLCSTNASYIKLSFRKSSSSQHP